MKAIILSAGQGRRLMPLTESMPKCCLMLDGKTLLAHQIESLAANGVEEVVVVTGFGHQVVHLARQKNRAAGRDLEPGGETGHVTRRQTGIGRRGNPGGQSRHQRVVPHRNPSFGRHHRAPTETPGKTLVNLIDNRGPLPVGRGKSGSRYKNH